MGGVQRPICSLFGVRIRVVPHPLFDSTISEAYTGGMDFNTNLQAKLVRMATQQGRDAQTLVQEAVERLVDHDEWFLEEVDKGLAAADRGEFIEHDAVRKLIDSRYPG
jgi:predicted transcriptional regulator